MEKSKYMHENLTNSGDLNSVGEVEENYLLTNGTFLSMDDPFFNDEYNNLERYLFQTDDHHTENSS